jgi:hypothetical protein
MSFTEDIGAFSMVPYLDRRISTKIACDKGAEGAVGLASYWCDNLRANGDRRLLDFKATATGADDVLCLPAHCRRCGSGCSTPAGASEGHVCRELGRLLFRVGQRGGSWGRPDWLSANARRALRTSSNPVIYEQSV